MMLAEVKERLPVIALKGVVIFPHTYTTIQIGSPVLKSAISAAIEGDKRAFVVTRKPEYAKNFLEKIDPAEIYSTGVIISIEQAVPIPDGTVRIVIIGQEAGTIESLHVEQVDGSPFTMAEVTPIEEKEAYGTESEAALRILKEKFEKLIEKQSEIPKEFLPSQVSIPPDVEGHVASLGTSIKAAYVIAYYIRGDVERKQIILEESDPVAKIEATIALVEMTLEEAEISKRVMSRVRESQREQQQEARGREMIDAIKKEMPSSSDEAAESTKIRERMEEVNPPDEIKERIEKELERLEVIPTISPEVGVITTYLDRLLSIPWNESTEDKLDLAEAKDVLDEDHYGLKDVKERVLEFLAVRKLKGSPSMRGPILCFIGPPGTGKTSLGKSIARAMGRKFQRMSLGGMRDEAEIRGHRRTYIGSMPGRVVRVLTEAKVNNPVVMFDEIDKVGQDWRGDPSSALLEVLDPEQNFAFVDNYLEVPIDLSKTFFICTGNDANSIPPPLKDRMEIIEFSGYTDLEKLAIANQYLVPKQREENGIAENITLNFTNEALLEIISGYTKESGVRDLERKIATVMRKQAKEVASNPDAPPVLEAGLDEVLGPKLFTHGTAEEENQVGVVQALAWTAFGGDVFPIEVKINKSNESHLTTTGNLGEVMKESAIAALSYCKGVPKFDPSIFEGKEIHIHASHAGTPKEGPSAGVTMATGIASALSELEVRADIAMTGEVSLRGRVQKVGGIKEKILSAHRAGIKEVIIPIENESDLKDVPEEVKSAIVIHPVKTMQEVLDIAIIGWNKDLSDD